MKKILRNNFYSIKWRGEAEPAKNGVFGGKKPIFEKNSCRLGGLFQDMLSTMGGLFPDLLSTRGGCFPYGFPGNFFVHIIKMYLQEGIGMASRKARYVNCTSIKIISTTVHSIKIIRKNYEKKFAQQLL